MSREWKVLPRPLRMSIGLFTKIVFLSLALSLKSFFLHWVLLLGYMRGKISFFQEGVGKGKSFSRAFVEILYLSQHVYNGLLPYQVPHKSLLLFQRLYLKVWSVVLLEFYFVYLMKKVTVLQEGLEKSMSRTFDKVPHIHWNKWQEKSALCTEFPFRVHGREGFWHSWRSGGGQRPSQDFHEGIQSALGASIRVYSGLVTGTQKDLKKGRSLLRSFEKVPCPS